MIQKKLSMTMDNTAHTANATPTGH